MFSGRKKKISTVRGRLFAIKHYHKMYQGREILAKHWTIDEVLKGVDRAHGESTATAKGRGPLTWQLLRSSRQALRESEEAVIGAGSGLVVCITISCT